MTLYEISYEIEEAFNAAINPETGEIIDEEAKTRLDALMMEQEEKIEGIALWIKNLRSDAEALKAEKLAFQRRQQITVNKAASLERYLAACLGPGNRFASNRVAISWRKSDCVELAEGKTVYDVDTHYIKAAEPTLDKAAIKKALEAGEQVDGVVLVEKQNMQIR